MFPCAGWMVPRRLHLKGDCIAPDRLAMPRPAVIAFNLLASFGEIRS